MLVVALVQSTSNEDARDDQCTGGSLTVAKSSVAKSGKLVSSDTLKKKE